MALLAVWMFMLAVGLAAAVNYPRQGVGAVALAAMLVVALAVTPYQAWRRSAAGKGY